MLPRVAFVCVLVLLGRTVEPVIAQQLSMEQLRDAAGNYARAAFPRLANLVATEQYEQRLRGSAAVLGTTSRLLTSEVLLVRHPVEDRDWLFFRDVLNVNGSTVPNHQNRLNTLFINPTAANWELVREIAHADRQYHLPGSTAAETNPFVVVALMDRFYWPRLQFKSGKPDKDVGPNVRTLELEELKSDEEPILVRGLARGTVWLDAATGRILQTDIRIAGGPAPATSRTTFRYDEKLQVAVPVEMKTVWRPSPVAAVNGSAKYANFRQFGVNTSESLKARP
jgi:hypothetical protein